MANIQYSFLKLAAVKASGLAFPLGLIGITGIWVWSARNRRSVPSQDDTNAPHQGADSANPAEYASYKPESGASSLGGNGRDAILGQILADNIRLREALK
jgi:hypothetical protein